MAQPLYARYVPPKKKSNQIAQDMGGKGASHGTPPETVPKNISLKATAENSKKRKRKSSSTKERESPKRKKLELRLDASALTPVEVLRDEAESEDKQQKDRVSKIPNGVKRSSESEVLIKNENKPVATNKHSSVISKYEKSLLRKNLEIPPQEKLDGEHDEPKAVVNDLVPIPIPRPVSTGPAFSAQAALPTWIANPTLIHRSMVSTFADLHVDSQLLNNLKGQGFENALPVQAGILPILLPSPTQHPGDLCVSAATGSGKTFAYVLPIIQDLMRQTGVGLRAVIVVPTRELVNQVRETFAVLTPGTGISVGIAVGTQPLEEEQSKLVGRKFVYDPSGYEAQKKCLEDEAQIRKLLKQLDRDLQLPQNKSGDMEDESRADYVTVYSSKVDILICTPGRLVEHIKCTEGFYLDKLEWLIVDEADRLLDSSFQEWVETVNEAIRAPEIVYENAFLSKMLDSGWQRPVRKVVLSATMTRDLQKLVDLELQNPCLIMVEGVQDAAEIATAKQQNGPNSTDLPQSLSEAGFPTGDGSEKPLYLINLLDEMFGGVRSYDTLRDSVSSSEDSESEQDLSLSDTSSESTESSSKSRDGTAPSTHPLANAVARMANIPNALIFTASNDNAHRLTHLIHQLRPSWSRFQSTLTKSSSSRSTRKSISAFQSGEIRLIITTERASRGIDLPNLNTVINYDIPHSITSYVHRVGRTARAGRLGNAWTLIEDKQARWFWKEVAQGPEIDRGNKVVQKIRLDITGVRNKEGTAYAAALKTLEHDVRHNKD